jgi:hypothetical protein
MGHIFRLPVGISLPKLKIEKVDKYLKVGVSGIGTSELDFHMTVLLCNDSEKSGLIFLNLISIQLII